MESSGQTRQTAWRQYRPLLPAFRRKDSFLPSNDVVSALRAHGLEIAENPTSKRDLTAMQEQFNAWREETGLPYAHLSRICAMAAGDNYDVETLRGRGVVDDGS